MQSYWFKIRARNLSTRWHIVRLTEMNAWLTVIIVLLSIAAVTWAYLNYLKIKAKYFDTNDNVSVDDIELEIEDNDVENTLSRCIEYDHIQQISTERDFDQSGAEMVETRY